MDQRFAPYNIHHISPKQFGTLDNHLRLLSEQPYRYEHPLIQALPRTVPGIYTIGGGRQIGKTTLLKQWMAALIKEGVPPKNIIFLTGELIDDHHALVDILRSCIDDHPEGEKLYIIIDEITYVTSWDRGIKFASDAGYLRDCILILTGSDLTLMQSARMTFPGRRGRADKVDFHVYPLSFKEFIKLKGAIANLESIVTTTDLPETKILTKIYDEFTLYQKHGGYLTAINDIAREGSIALTTLKTYSDWIRGDVLKRGKQELYLKEILGAIIQRYNKQVTWHNIADTISTDSSKTVADYCELLATMDALFIQSALQENKLAPAPKKARKLTFTDPFIYHAIKQWVSPLQNPNEKIDQDINDPIISSEIVEAIVSNHYHRIYPTYYIKAEGEIDLAYVANKKFWPIEIKWRNQIRQKDVKQLQKYKNSVIFSKVAMEHAIDGIPILPLPLALLRLRETDTFFQ